MANDHHKELANFIKQVHSSLRSASRRDGAQKAWYDHCNNTHNLKQYATCMEKLATTFWEENACDSKKHANSRIEWLANYIYKYYLNDGIEIPLVSVIRSREIYMGKKLNIDRMKIVQKKEDVIGKLDIVDVGSCYNPFSLYDKFNVIPLDLFPARDGVYQCDFLNIEIGEKFTVENNSLKQLEKDKYHAVIFCFVLEYLPTSQQRLHACCNAYKILKTEGLLLIATPDSNHVGANANIMKSWKYTLAQQGFTRVKYEKLPHMHCMAFRKSLYPDITKRWVETRYDRCDVTMEICIPQDFQNTIIPKAVPYTTYSADSEDVLETFELLPDYDIFD